MSDRPPIVGCTCDACGLENGARGSFDDSELRYARHKTDAGEEGFLMCVCTCMRCGHVNMVGIDLGVIVEHVEAEA